MTDGATASEGRRTKTFGAALAPQGYGDLTAADREAECWQHDRGTVTEVGRDVACAVHARRSGQISLRARPTACLRLQQGTGVYDALDAAPSTTRHLIHSHSSRRRLRS
jgi:hypothetical protein